MRTLVKNLFGETAIIKKYEKIAAKINELETVFETYSDEELQNKTKEFKQQLENGASIDQIKTEAFAAVREAAKRVLGQRHYDVQLIGGLALLDGQVAEMQTGEGKTLVASLPSYLFALLGKGVHIITANEYLARRDCETIGQLHQFLGLTVGLNISQLSMEEKHVAYSADITYGTGNEFGFDYLRDHLVYDINQKVQRGQHFAIVDEIDSILIDEARTPLIIANKSSVYKDLFKVASLIVKGFKENIDYELFQESRQIVLTEEGATKIEQAFAIDNIYDSEHQTLMHFIAQSLQAHVILKKDVDYIVKDGEIHLVDAFTGRVMEGRSYSDGLHQAIEAKEGVEIKEENETQATISIQNYFRLYEQLSGMTGTAIPAKKEFQSTYGLNVVAIPTHKPRIRKDFDDLLFISLEKKLKKIVDEVKHYHSLGRPVLIGTTSIQQSEQLSDLLTKEGLRHQLLNAKSEEQEAKMIAIAGQKGRITIATNMAGRGTDILLGEGVTELGGLHILGTERHESLRIDLQLRGRAGRQGDPGSSQFILSLEDDLLQNLEQEDLEKWTKRVKTDENGLVISPDPLKFINKVQSIIEGMHYSSREHLFKLDSVVDEQRKALYKSRDKLLEDEDVTAYLFELIKNHVDSLISIYCPPNSIPEEWDKEIFFEKLSLVMPIGKQQMDSLDVDESEQLTLAVNSLLSDYEQKVMHLGLDPSQTKMMILRAIDQFWLRHLDDMLHLKEGIHLRSYGQEDPYRTYEIEGYHLFQEMLDGMREAVSQQFFASIHSSMNSSDFESER